MTEPMNIPEIIAADPVKLAAFDADIKAHWDRRERGESDRGGYERGADDTMSENAEPKVLYDRLQVVHQQIDWLIDADTLELRDLAHNLADDLESAYARLDVAYRRIDALTAALSAPPEETTP